MPILRIKEIRGMAVEDRQKRLGELQTELVRLRTMIKAGGSIENPARVQELRKTIARIMTIQKEPKPVEKRKKEPKRKAKKRTEKKEKKNLKEDKKE